MIKPVILAAIMVFMMSSPQWYSDAQAQLEASGAYELEEKLPEETQELLENAGIELSADGIGQISAAGLLESIGDMDAGYIQKPLRACLSALCVAVLCSAAGTVMEKKEGGLPASFDTVASAAASMAVCVPMAAFVDRTADTISSVCRFSTVLVPVLSGLAAASGHSAAAAAYSAFTLTVVEVLNIIIPDVVIPVLRVLLGIAAVSGLMPSLGLDKLAGAVEKNAKWLMGLIGVLMSGALGVSSVAAAAADGAAIKATRFVISGAVPVVGGALSDAIGTITNCITIVRTSAGAFGLIAGLFIVLPAAINAVIWMTGLNCSAWAADALGAGRPAAAMRSLGGVVSLILGLLALVTVLTTCSAAVVMKLRGA